MEMPSCIGWLFEISIEHDNNAVIWIKTIDKKILKLTDSYRPSFYVLPRCETDGLYLFQILSRQHDVVEQIRWEESKLTDLFGYNDTEKKKKKKLIYVQIQSIRYYQPLLKKIGEDFRVKQLFNTDLSHIQQYLFTRLRMEPTSKVKIEYSDSKMLQISKIDDDEEQGEVSQSSPPPFSLLYFDLHTFSGILASDNGIMLIKVRYESHDKKEREKEDIFFQNSEENAILQEFSNYVHDKDPDIIICMGDYGDNTVLHYLFARAKNIGFDLQLGRDIVDNDDFKHKRAWNMYGVSRVNSLKNILVCLYGSTGSLWNRYGDVLAFEEINKLSIDILIKTKDIVQESGYELVYADTDSVFIKKRTIALPQQK